MRPKQWAKNVFLFGALVFDKKLFDLSAILKTSAAFVLFCLLSSSVYLINDLVDMERDRQHPTKRNRPLASGQLQPWVAVGAAIAFILISLAAAFLLETQFGFVAASYIIIMVLYSFSLKNVVIVDVLTIAAGFVLRVVAGTVVFRVERFSPWLYVCMTALALLISVGKRRHEIILLAEGANNHRAILDEYNVRLLDNMLNIATSTAIVAYSLYTFSAPNLPPNNLMMLTIPLVLYGLLRYLYLIHVKGEGGAPEDVTLKDKPILIVVALWGLLSAGILYLS
jgi:4-hydroxybenzoate polyprenyltransferase